MTKLTCFARVGICWGVFSSSLDPLPSFLGPPVFWRLVGLTCSEPSDSLCFLGFWTTTLIASRKLRRTRIFWCWRLSCGQYWLLNNYGMQRNKMTAISCSLNDLSFPNRYWKCTGTIFRIRKEGKINIQLFYLYGERPNQHFHRVFHISHNTAYRCADFRCIITKDKNEPFPANIFQYVPAIPAWGIHYWTIFSFPGRSTYFIHDTSQMRFPELCRCWTTRQIVSAEHFLHFSFLSRKVLFFRNHLKYSALSSILSTFTFVVSSTCSFAVRTRSVALSLFLTLLMSGLVIRLGELEGLSRLWNSSSSLAVLILPSQPNITGFRPLSWTTVL